MTGAGILKFGRGRIGGSKSGRLESFDRQRRLDIIDQDVETMQRVFEIEGRA